MVRTGVIDHPSQWPASGYVETQNPRQRYRLIDQCRLAALLGFAAIDDLRESHRIWVQEGLKSDGNIRESKWTESVAVGSRDYVEEMKDCLKIKGRKIVESNGACELRESPLSTYHNDCADDIDVLRDENTYLWESHPL